MSDDEQAMTTEPNKEAAALEAGYTAGHRAYEIGGMLLTTSGCIWLCVRLAKCQPLSGWWVPLAAFIGILLADFCSGLFHWAFDTWGNLDTPVFGRLAIRTFRHHHVDQKAMLKHDFIETNGHNIALASLWTYGGLYSFTPETASLGDVFFGMVCVSATIFVSITSQIHKWAHMDVAPPFIRLLQRTYVILSPEHHSAHHVAPYSRNYCITVGWLNGPLRFIRFFETLERIISALTGAIPREDDLGKKAAEAAREEEENAEATGVLAESHHRDG